MNLNSSRPGFKVRIIRRKKRKKAGKIKQEVAVDAFPLALFFENFCYNIYIITNNCNKYLR